MPSEAYKEIEKIVDRLKGVEGVIGIILFGSYSRGDFDEGSDVDLLIVFKDKKTLAENQELIYEATSRSDLFIQAVTLTLDELRNSPLLETLRREGKTYHSEAELSKLLAATHKPYALLTYTTRKLTAKQRVIFSQKLEGRRDGKYLYPGLLQRVGGQKIGRGVVMIPIEKQKEVVEYLEAMKVDYMIRYVWA
ncbi:MAG: nucleotidyltransferase domain-containing protein [Candidatus Bathyarchaeia archaeon]